METQFKDKWAILLGVNKYNHVRDLKYCINDIEALKKDFQQYLEFPEDHIFEYSDDAEKKPERDTIYHELAELCQGQTIQPDDLLVFYFTGHGMIDPGEQEDYLLPCKASPFILKHTAIKMDDLVGVLKKTGCKNIVMFIDACREAVEGQKGIISIGENSKSVVERAGVVSFFSCDPTDFSYEIDELSHGSFTYCILEAIKDKNCNSINEIYEFLRRNVPIINKKYKKPAQQPYAIIEPAEKAKLNIFSSHIQIKEIEDILDQLKDHVGDLFANQELDVRTFNKTIEIIEFARGKKGGELIRRKIKLIEQLCKGDLACISYRVALEAIERRHLRGPERKRSLEKLE